MLCGIYVISLHHGWSFYMLPRKQVILVIHSRFIASHVHGSTYSLTIIVMS